MVAAAWLILGDHELGGCHIESGLTAPDPHVKVRALTPSRIDRQCDARIDDTSRTRHNLKARDRAAGVALHLLDAVAARCRRRIVAPARRTFDELERPVRLRATAPRRAPVGVLTPKIHVADPDSRLPMQTS